MKPEVVEAKNNEAVRMSPTFIELRSIRFPHFHRYMHRRKEIVDYNDYACILVVTHLSGAFWLLRVIASIVKSNRHRSPMPIPCSFSKHLVT